MIAPKKQYNNLDNKQTVFKNYLALLKKLILLGK